MKKRREDRENKERPKRKKKRKKEKEKRKKRKKEEENEYFATNFLLRDLLSAFNFLPILKNVGVDLTEEKEERKKKMS